MEGLVQSLEYRTEILAWLFLMTTVFLVCRCLPPHCAHPPPSQGGSKQALSTHSHKETNSSWRLTSITSSETDRLSKVLSKRLHIRDGGVVYSAALWIFLREPSAYWVQSAQCPGCCVFLSGLLHAVSVLPLRGPASQNHPLLGFL